METGIFTSAIKILIHRILYVTYMTVLYSPLQRLVVGRENETTIEKGIGNGALVFAFLVCFFFILSSCKEPTSGQNDSPGGQYL